MSGDLQPLPWFQEPEDVPFGDDQGAGFSVSMGVRFRIGRHVRVGSDGMIYPALLDMETYIGEMEPDDG